MPWLTPDELPEEDECRPLFIPANEAWLAIVSGAILELTREWNWEQFGALTPAQCAAAMLNMQQRYYDDACTDCVLPTGERVIRVGLDGHLQELRDGSWQEPSGDYAVPAVPPRSGGTDDELRCLAAANAELTLAALYEEVTDMFNNHISLAEAITAFAVAIGVAIAPPLGLAAASLLAVGGIAFGEFYAFLDFLTEDVWTSEFSDALRCMLYECSGIGAGVVTFDIDCLWIELQQQTNPFDLSFSELRLLGQVGYLLTILSADGLNLAGATTAIESANCDCGSCVSRVESFVDGEVNEWTTYGAGVDHAFTTSYLCGSINPTAGRGGGACFETATGCIASNTAGAVAIDLGQECNIVAIACWTRASVAGKTEALDVSLYDESKAFIGRAILATRTTSTAWAEWWSTTPQNGVRYVVFKHNAYATPVTLYVDDLSVTVA